MTDQNQSDFQTGFGAAAHATLDTEQLISCLRVAFVDTHSSLPDFEEGIIPVFKVHNCFSRFMISWTVLFLKELETQLVF